MNELYKNIEPNKNWNLSKWVDWHKYLIKKYWSMTVAVEKKDNNGNIIKLIANPLASSVFNTYYNKYSSFSIGFELSNPIDKNTNPDKLYLRMFIDLIPSAQLGFIENNPQYTLISTVYEGGKLVVNKVSDVASLIYTATKYFIYAIIIIGGLVLYKILIKEYREIKNKN